MTDPSEGIELELTWATLKELLNSTVTRTRYWWASELMDDLSLTDEEVDALRQMPTQYRQWATAQLLDIAESIREASRDLDGQLLRLTGELTA